MACDIRGDFSIFDFGLAKEIKKADLVEEPDTYICTGLTGMCVAYCRLCRIYRGTTNVWLYFLLRASGSRRWMAPEVVECRDYGLSADVFSFGLLFWNVMALK